MTEISFYFSAPSRTGYACRLVRQAQRQGMALAVTGPAAALAEFDRELWSFAGPEFVPHGPIKRAFARRLAQVGRVDCREQLLDQRTAAAVGLAVGKARHRRTQPRHGAERAGRPGIGDGSVEQHATDGNPPTFRRRPKCPAPRID